MVRYLCFSLMSFVFVVLAVHAGTLFGEEWKASSLLLIFCAAVSAVPLIDPLKALMGDLAGQESR